jgi:hypothetical protein
MICQYYLLADTFTDKDERFPSRIIPIRNYNYNGDIDSPPGTIPHVKGELPGKDNYWHIERHVMTGYA